MGMQVFFCFLGSHSHSYRINVSTGFSYHENGLGL